MFPELTELLLIGCLMESIWTPRFKSNILFPKTQLADMLTKRNFTRDERSHLLCWFNNSHFSSINSVKAMSKRTQESADEERVTAKSVPMMNLVSRCRVRDPTVLVSTASESLGITKSESQKVPLSLLNVHSSQNGRCSRNCLKKSKKSECPDIWIPPPRHKWPESWSSMEDPVVPFARNLYGHPWAGLLWERQFEKILLEHGWEKSS